MQGHFELGETMQQQQNDNPSIMDINDDSSFVMSDAQISEYLENGAGISPDAEAQGSIMTLITFIAMC